MATAKGGEVPSARKKTEVPGQALGYALQYTRLTQMLLQAPEGSFCSMEIRQRGQELLFRAGPLPTAAAA